MESICITVPSRNIGIGVKRSHFILWGLTTHSRRRLLLLTVEKIDLYIPEPCWALWQPHSLKTELKTTGAPAWKHLQNSHMLGKKRPFLRTVPFHPWTHTKEPLVPTASDTGQLSQRNEPTRASLQNSRQLLHPFFLAPGKNEQPRVLLEAIVGV